MNETINFLIKIIIASFLLSIIIKYLGPSLSLASTNINALILVMILPLTITVFLTKKMLSNISDS